MTRIALIVVSLALAALLLAIAPRSPAVWFAAVALVGAAALSVALAPRGGARLEETERIQDATIGRRGELVRGTSLRLREMQYRYSVRHDERGRVPFSARINQIRLGFVPVIITDNETDVQGLGFVAFVHDGHRWRGPGLPCAGAPDDALAHAARHVEPLREIEDATADRTDDSVIDAESERHGDDTDDGEQQGDSWREGPDRRRWDTGSGWEDGSETGDDGAPT